MEVIFVILLNLLGMAQTIEQSEQWIAGGTQQICGKTRDGCYCKEQWPHKGRLLSGCQRPDNDPYGPWCIIDQNDPQCIFDPIKDKYITEEGNFTGDYWKYCESYYCLQGSGVQKKKITCDRTSAGCTCKQRWSHFGRDGFLYNDYSGCANPDNDVLGDWCIIEPGSCVDTPLAQRQQSFQFKNILSGTWDRCECRGTALPSIIISASPDGAKTVEIFNITVDQDKNSNDCDPGVVPSCFHR